jgi:ubiquitin-activating enzyme E1
VLDNIPKDYNDCVKFALNQFQEYYSQQIFELLYKFPEDTVTSSGSRFWSGAKKCPHIVTFDKENQNHLDYIVAFSSLWANIFGIKINPKSVLRVIENYSFSEPKIRGDINIAADEKEEEANKKLEEEKSKILDLHDLLNELPDPTQFRGIKIIPQDFEKDDDTNFHIDFITAASNMRAINYDIETADKHNTKGIAGKIIPALATVTTVVAGFATLELYKLVQGFTDLEKYNNTFLNLALPYIGSSDPIGVKKHTVGGKEYSMWDTFVINKDYTLKEFIEYFERDHNLEIDTVMYGSFMIYGIILNAKKVAKRMDTSIRKIIEDELEVKLTGKSITLQICTDTDDMEDETELPEVLYIL